MRDSGMPDEAYWESLFDVPLIISRLGIQRFRDVAELGCGYGTFSIPVARAISGTLYTFDMDPSMVARTRERGRGLRITAAVRDVMVEGFGVQADAVLLFNILHCEEPVTLLRRAAEALKPGGEVLVIHWRRHRHAAWAKPGYSPHAGRNHPLGLRDRSPGTGGRRHRPAAVALRISVPAGEPLKRPLTGAGSNGMRNTAAATRVTTKRMSVFAASASTYNR